MKAVFYLVLIICSCNFAVAKTIKVGYPEFKPYTYTENGVAKGIGIDAIKKIAIQLKVNAEIYPIETYGNGFTRLKKGKLDAVLLASQNSERDKIAVFSQPITSNDWSWFSLPNKSLTRPNIRTKVATYLRANTHTWLIKNNFEFISATTDVSAMLRQLDKGRVDTIFVSEQVLLHELERLGKPQHSLTITKEVTKPFGIYVAKPFLKLNPDFMTQLNNSIENL